MTEPGDQLPPIDFTGLTNFVEVDPPPRPRLPWYRHRKLWVASGSVVAVVAVVVVVIIGLALVRGNDEHSFPVNPNSSCTMTSGHWVISQSDGEAVAKTEGVKVKMTGAGVPSLWCLDAIHEYDGNVTMDLRDGPYEFRNSDSEHPLRFKVSNERYVYQDGRGVVVTPAGRSVRFGP
jgi:hypothetical protein